MKNIKTIDNTEINGNHIKTRKFFLAGKNRTNHSDFYKNTYFGCEYIDINSDKIKYVEVTRNEYEKHHKLIQYDFLKDDDGKIIDLYETNGDLNNFCVDQEDLNYFPFIFYYQYKKENHIRETMIFSTKFHNFLITNPNVEGDDKHGLVGKKLRKNLCKKKENQYAKR